jgi:CBS domain-containing protein
MHDKKLYGLCVMGEDGQLAGILTVTDVLEAFICIFKNPA